MATYPNILVLCLYLPATHLTNHELDWLGNLLRIPNATMLGLLLMMTLTPVGTKEETKIITQGYVHEILRNILLCLREKSAKL